MRNDSEALCVKDKRKWISTSLVLTLLSNHRADTWPLAAAPNNLCQWKGYLAPTISGQVTVSKIMWEEINPYIYQKGKSQLSHSAMCRKKKKKKTWLVFDTDKTRIVLTSAPAFTSMHYFTQGRSAPVCNIHPFNDFLYLLPTSPKHVSLPVPQTYTTSVSLIIHLINKD